MRRLHSAEASSRVSICVYIAFGQNPVNVAPHRVFLTLQAGINYGDDLNMPKLDPYETAMPISLIRQHLGWGHWFDRAKLTQKNINNTQ